MVHAPVIWHLSRVAFLTRKNDHLAVCNSCHVSHVAADISKLDTRCRGDGRGSAALQKKLDSSSLGNDGDLQLRLHGCLVLLLLSLIAMATMMTIHDRPRLDREPRFG